MASSSGDKRVEVFGAHAALHEGCPRVVAWGGPHALAEASCSAVTKSLLCLPWFCLAVKWSWEHSPVGREMLEGGAAVGTVAEAKAGFVLLCFRGPGRLGASCTSAEGSPGPEVLEAHSQAGRADQDGPALWPARVPLPVSVSP